ncbi:hypothetical protein H9Q74_004935 [Fusarium xylarioides]|nr:hypothetical protein H9Q71_005391 [Fusarium xylarioides]KAG5824951.1 hypothetical protein H9Q74_004935 [Fusarium xylarioides]
MADVYYALNGGGLKGSPPDPAITEPPEAYNRDILKRQNVGTYDVCGYYSIPGQCSASGCVTAISTDSDGDELTLYPFCTTKDMEVTMYKELEGVSATIEPSIESTSEPTSSDGAKTETTGESNTQETTSSAKSSSSSEPDSPSNSSTPVGATVGGVLGGLALLALIGFGLWFIRHKKRQAGNGSHVVATDQPPVVPYYQQQPVTHTQGEANYQPLVSGMSPEPKAYSPSSNMRHSAFNELQSFHHDGTNPAGYR